MKKLLIIILFLIATPVSAKMLWEYGDFNERAVMAVDNGIVANISEYKGTFEQNISLLSVVEKNGKIEYLGASTQPAALTTYNLAGAGVSSSNTSITLQSLTIPQNDYPIQDSDLSDTFYLTIEPGSKTRQEIASCTTVAQNSGGTATLSGCTRGLSPITPYTASSTLQFSHAGGSQVIFSDPPQLFNSYPAKANSEAITGQWTFNTVLPSSSLTATTSEQFTTKEYVDNTTNQGAATSTESVAGISELATRTEQASSTPWGANEPHVMQSENATSTPYADSIGAGYACVTEDDGNLSADCLPLGEVLAFTGNNTHAGAEEFTASTTMLNASSTNITVNGVDGANNFNSGNADSLHLHEYSKLHYATTTDGHIASEQKALFASSTIPALTLGTDNIIRIKVNLDLWDLGSGETSTFILKYGDASSLTLDLVNNGGDTASAFQGNVTAEIMGAGTTNSQKVSMNAVFGDGTIVDTAADSNTRAFIYGSSGTFSTDSTVAQEVTIYAVMPAGQQADTANAYIEILQLN